MLKAIGGTIGVLMLAACPNDNAQTLTMGSTATMSFAYDSVTHGGGDLTAATTDTAFVTLGSSKSGSASSTSSTGSTTTGITCNATVSYDNPGSPRAVALVLSCPGQ